METFICQIILFLNTSCKYQMNNKVLRLKFHHLLNIIFNEIMGFRLRCGIALANGIYLFIYRKSDLILVLFIINIKESIFIFFLHKTPSDLVDHLSYVVYEKLNFTIQRSNVYLLKVLTQMKIVSFVKCDCLEQNLPILQTSKSCSILIAFKFTLPFQTLYFVIIGVIQMIKCLFVCKLNEFCRLLSFFY